MPRSAFARSGTDTRMMNAVIEHTRNVSKYTPRVCTRPCLTGCVTAAEAPALGAEPRPASLENMPRLTPVRMMYPSVAPTTSFGPNAWVKIVATAAGSRSMFSATMTSPMSRYSSAMSGTRSWVTEAMRRTPPKMTSAISALRTIPITHGSQAEAESSRPPAIVAWMVLACSEEKATGKQMMRMTANTTPIQRARSPRCM